MEIGYDKRLESVWFGVERDFFDELVKAEEGLEVTAVPVEPVKAEDGSDAVQPAGGIKKHFVACYGVYNEVRYAKQQIMENGMKFDDVCLYYTSREYENFIRSIFGSAEIPVCFTRSAQACETRLVRFMLDVLQFVQDDYSYRSLQKVVRNTILKEKAVFRAYNRAIRENIGFYKDSYLKYCERKREEIAAAGPEVMAEAAGETDKWAGFLEAITGVFDENRTLAENYKALLDFTKENTRSDPKRKLLMSRLKEQAAVYGLLGGQMSGAEQIEQMRRFLLELTYQDEECCGYGAVQAVYLREPEFMERKYNFFMGLSYSNMVQKEIDSPVLSDEELENAVDFAGKVPERIFARERNAERVRNLERTLETAGEGEIYLSYSYYDVVNFKEVSPSLFYLEQRGAAKEQKEDRYLLEEKDVYIEWETVAPVLTENAEKKTEKKNNATYVGENENKNISREEAEEEAKESRDGDDEDENPKEDGIKAIVQNPNPAGRERKMSASGMQTMLACPLKYYYHYEKKLPEREYREWDATRWLTPGAKGTLFHRIMKLYCDKEFIEADISGQAIRAELSEEVLKMAFSQAVEEAERENPVENKTVRQKELYEVEGVVRKELSELHGELSGQGNLWKILGCEIGFGGLGNDNTAGGDVLVEYNVPNSNLKIMWMGSIDRLDGCFKNNDGKEILCLRIVDYKTGKSEKLKKKLDGYTCKVKAAQKTVLEGEQIQHFVYAQAALEYVNKYAAEIAKRFGKTKIDEVEICEVYYDFPYEGVYLDVSGKVARAFDKNSHSVRYPENMEKMLIGMFEVDALKDKFMEEGVRKRE